MKSIICVLLLAACAGFAFAGPSAPSQNAPSTAAPKTPILLVFGAYGLSPAAVVMAVIQAWGDQATSPIPDEPQAGVKELKRDLRKDGGGLVPWPPVQPPQPPPTGP